MAQRDLDAALQLLADRAQYITGATGAAIALKRDGRNDMLCRASAGSNAPELGALLSAEYGLSGESVRTRRPLRCDDAERDARVNREVCRKLGIASVVVMPVVNDDEVLGVFELFSGKANAFGERDLSAVQRLSEMVETAVRLAHATEKLPEQLNVLETATSKASLAKEIEKDILEVDVIEPETSSAAPSVEAAPSLAEVAGHATVDGTSTPSEKIEKAPEIEKVLAAAVPSVSAAWANPAGSSVQTAAADSAPASAPATKFEPASPPKPLFWSAAQIAETEEAQAESDQSHVPPVLRSLRKCEVCGFPITAGRSLCVECEEKRWRGQLRRPSPLDRATVDRVPGKAAVSVAKVWGGAAAAAAAPAKTATATAQVPAPAVQKAASVVESPKPAPAIPAESKSKQEPLLFSAGLKPEQSWLSRNKFVIVVLLAVAAAAAFFLLR